MRINLYNDREATENGGESLLTRAECNALRGIAILGIFLHNFCHWLTIPNTWFSGLPLLTFLKRRCRSRNATLNARFRYLRP